jgi:hypothetical protein
MGKLGVSMDDQGAVCSAWPADASSSVSTTTKAAA